MAIEVSHLTSAERRFVAEALLDDVISSFEIAHTAPDGWELRCLERSVLQFSQSQYEGACIEIATAAALVARRPSGARSEPCSRSEVFAIRRAFETLRQHCSDFTCS